jgi:hypothetical protein
MQVLSQLAWQTKNFKPSRYSNHPPHPDHAFGFGRKERYELSHLYATPKAWGKDVSLSGRAEEPASPNDANR